MERLMLIAKKFALFVFSVLLTLYSLVTRKKMKKEDIRRVGILFLRPMGIGDLIMLSPAIQALAHLFPQAAIELVTWVPEVIAFDHITVRKHTEVNAKEHGYDLIISPTVAFTHLPFIWRAKFWVGYFTWPRIQSNIAGVPHTSFNMRYDHYLTRGTHLVTALAGDSETRHTVYPPLIQQKPTIFDTDNLANEQYLVTGIYSKQKDRQWPLEYFARIIDTLLKERRVTKVILTGDTSPENQAARDELGAHLNLRRPEIVDAIGKCNLPETSYLLARSHVYLGLDSGPSHLAYLTAPRSVVLFVTVPPELRLPLIENERHIRCVYPDPAPEKPLYTGYGPVPEAEAKKYIQRISREAVWNAIEEVLT